MKLEDYTISHIATVQEGLIKMEKVDIHSLVVSDGVGDVVGTFSKTDFIRKSALQARISEKMKVHEVMNSNVVHVEMGNELEQCFKVMHRYNLTELPVIKDRKLQGILRATNVACHLLDEHESLIEQLNVYICGSQLSHPIIRKHKFLIAS